MGNPLLNRIRDEEFVDTEFDASVRPIGNELSKPLFRPQTHFPDRVGLKPDARQPEL